MSDLRIKVAQTRDLLAILPGGIEARLEQAFGRHLFGRAFHSPKDEELQKNVDDLIEIVIKNRQTNSTYRSRARASGVATEVCNLASEYPIGGE